MFTPLVVIFWYILLHLTQAKNFRIRIKGKNGIIKTKVRTNIAYTRVSLDCHKAIPLSNLNHTYWLHRPILDCIYSGG